MAGRRPVRSSQPIGLPGSVLKKDGKIKGIIARHFDETLEIEANVVVGADGVESRVGKWAGPKCGPPLPLIFSKDLEIGFCIGF